MRSIRAAAAERAPLRGAVRVIVVLVDFTDKRDGQPPRRTSRICSSRLGMLPHGSVTEYYKEVTGGLVDINGEVVGPLPDAADPRLVRQRQLTASATRRATSTRGPTSWRTTPPWRPTRLSTSSPTTTTATATSTRSSSCTPARAARRPATPATSGRTSGRCPQAYNADGTKIYAYLTIPEDAKLGVCAHELGHLLFGFPDLYDTDYTSEGIGNWCLMAGGSWNGGGDTPGAPVGVVQGCSQGWVTVDQRHARTATLDDPRRQDQPRRATGCGRTAPSGQRVLPAREPPADRLRRRPAGGRPADLAHRRGPAGQHRREPLPGRARAGRRAQATSRTTSTAATAATPIPARPPIARSTRPPPRTRTTTPVPTRGCRSSASRRRPRR